MREEDEIVRLANAANVRNGKVNNVFAPTKIKPLAQPKPPLVTKPMQSKGIVGDVDRGITNGVRAGINTAKAVRENTAKVANALRKKFTGKKA